MSSNKSTPALSPAGKTSGKEPDISTITQPYLRDGSVLTLAKSSPDASSHKKERVKEFEGDPALLPLTDGIPPKPLPAPLALAALTDLLKGVDYLAFDKMDMDVYSPTLLYGIMKEQGPYVFYVTKKVPNRFQLRQEINLVSADGKGLVQIVVARSNPHKVKVFCGDKNLGSVVQTRIDWCGCSPRFTIRDPQEGKGKKLMAEITSQHTAWCLICQKLGCHSNYGVYYVNEAPVGGESGKGPGRFIAAIYRDASLDDKAPHEGIIELRLANKDGEAPLTTEMKVMILAAAVFIDFTLFVSEGGRMDLKVIICIALVVLALLGGAIVGLVLS